MTDKTLAPENTKGRRRGLLFLPLLAFLLLSGIFLMQLLSGRDITAIPSALIGKPAPQIALAALEGSNLPGIDPATLFPGKVSVVNVWGSWCVPCRLEHPMLMELTKDDRVQFVGINYKDEPANALRFLSELGNPYEVIGTDRNGKAGIEWGVYGVPETFVIGKDGTIRYKHIGPITKASLEQQMIPEIEKALAQPE